MKEGICREGEIFYVPSRCWHRRSLLQLFAQLQCSNVSNAVVINLEETVALTQNFVGERELANVLYFMKHRQSGLSPLSIL